MSWHTTTPAAGRQTTSQPPPCTRSRSYERAAKHPRRKACRSRTAGSAPGRYSQESKRFGPRCTRRETRQTGRPMGGFPVVSVVADSARIRPPVTKVVARNHFDAPQCPALSRNGGLGKVSKRSQLQGKTWFSDVFCTLRMWRNWQTRWVQDLAHPRLPKQTHLWQECHCGCGNNARMAENRCPLRSATPSQNWLRATSFAIFTSGKGFCDEF